MKSLIKPAWWLTELEVTKYYHHSMKGRLISPKYYQNMCVNHRKVCQ